ncbi:MAG TPA: hypothetical protein VFG72_05380 [Marmoricola sp.]|nr:hypothetical protein [Marmoricola sp.]
MDAIPPLTHPDNMPPVRSQADLQRTWRALMGPLGFAGRSLWLLVLDGLGHPTPVILQVEEMPPRPDAEMGRSLVHVVSSVAEDAGQVVFLLSRPGRDGLTADDLAWALLLQDVARQAGMPVWPVHRANDHALVVIAPDDLSASA